jgi:hypothetical protein
MQELRIPRERRTNSQGYFFGDSHLKRYRQSKWTATTGLVSAEDQFRATTNDKSSRLCKEHVLRSLGMQQLEWFSKYGVSCIYGGSAHNAEEAEFPGFSSVGTRGSTSRRGEPCRQSENHPDAGLHALRHPRMSRGQRPP